MPKKQPRNAFYFFMQDFKEEQRKIGNILQNMSEVSIAAGPVWQTLPPPARAKYEERAKKEKQKFNTLDLKFTSTGESLAEIDEKEKKLREEAEAELRDIRNFVMLNSFNSNEALMKADLYVMDVNCFCQVADGEFLVGESALLRFNLIDGIKDTYHELINPGHIPVGYARDVKLGCEEFGLEMPDETANRSNYMQILATIVDYLKQQDKKMKTLPPIYTVADKTKQVECFIQQMCNRAGEDETLFRVYTLDTLFYHMINAIRSRPEEGFPKVSLATTQLKKDAFKYSPGLACKHHSEIDKSVECALSRAKRWAFTILDSCCPVGGVDMQPGAHLPRDYDLDSILTMKEQKRVRSGPSVAGAACASSCNTSVSDSFGDTSVNKSTLNSTDESTKKKRTGIPSMRMPKQDYSQALLRPAPELTDADLLSSGVGAIAISSSIGRGRGRGLPPTTKQ